MKRVDLRDPPPLSLKGCAMTLGCFDGIHLGHQEIIRRLREEAQKRRLKTALCLLHPHPQKILRPTESFKRLFSIDETEDILRPFGLDFFCLFPFDKALARLSPEKFIACRIMPLLAPKLWLAGYDFAFGAGRRGDFSLLQKLSSKFGFEAVQAPPVTAEAASPAAASASAERPAGAAHPAAGLSGGAKSGKTAGASAKGKGGSDSGKASPALTADQIPANRQPFAALSSNSEPGRARARRGKPRQKGMPGRGAQNPRGAGEKSAAGGGNGSAGGGEPVSASKIKRLLAEGRVWEANQLLGGIFFFSGTVVKGEGRGRNLGFPTANLLPPLQKAPLKRGVYIIEAAAQKGRFLPGVMNIGFRPTFFPKAPGADLKRQMAQSKPKPPDAFPLDREEKSSSQSQCQSARRRQGESSSAPLGGQESPPGRKPPGGAFLARRQREDSSSLLRGLSPPLPDFVIEKPCRLYYEAHIIESAGSGSRAAPAWTAPAGTGKAGETSETAQISETNQTGQTNQTGPTRKPGAPPLKPPPGLPAGPPPPFWLKSLCGRALHVRVHYFLREERAFASAAALRRQIQKDIQKALKFFSLPVR